ncbi:hypothetical protein RUM43_003109 [Polyplax serrata]|uniref:BED-type domain-containing protein n=1 Tax=Polyplax serrata TaxID=468196 RepID=A0AAN8PNQ9_POLSC
MPILYNNKKLLKTPLEAVLRINRENPIWNFFTLEEPRNLAWCQTCRRPLKYRKGMSKTSNLIQHLRLHHGKYQAFLRDKSQRALGLFRAIMPNF